MKKFRFIAEEDLTVVAIYLDKVQAMFPVSKVPELAAAREAAVEALGQTFDAQDRGLFLSTQLRVLEQLELLGKVLIRHGEVLLALQGRSQLAQQIAGPPPRTPNVRFQQTEPQPEKVGQAMIPGEELEILNFDDFEGGVAG